MEWPRQRRQHADNMAPDHEDEFESDVDADHAEPQEPPFDEAAARARYPPRTCRICLGSEEPQFFPPRRTMGIRTSAAKPVFMSDDPELGRLLSPCLCKGTQKYVHEGCLNAWRQTNPGSTRNWWECPTCHYKYRLSRMRWAGLVHNRWAKLLLTLVVFTIAVFLLGYVADPIFDLWLDPIGTVGDTISNVVGSDADPMFEPTSTWSEHFLKGFFSLGVVGVIKSTLLMSPVHWITYRIGGRRRRGTGRDRVENMSLILVLIGTWAALRSIWSIVGRLSERFLQDIHDKVLDVDEDEPKAAPEPKVETPAK